MLQQYCHSKFYGLHLEGIQPCQQWSGHECWQQTNQASAFARGFCVPAPCAVLAEPKWLRDSSNNRHSHNENNSLARLCAALHRPDCVMGARRAQLAATSAWTLRRQSAMVVPY
eukprot:6353911-Amphidinium_carterae.1